MIPRRPGVPSALRALLLALAAVVLPSPAQASLTGLGEVSSPIPELSTALPRELPGPCEGELCGELEAPQPKTRVRGFELDLYCRLGGEDGLSCRPRQVWVERYDGSASERSVFTGHYFDTETNLYYAKARYFDPELGRFLSQDSYLGELTEPPSLHRYLYAWDRPTYYVDLDGHDVDLAERARQEQARRAALKERAGAHSYSNQGQGCGTRCEQDAYYEEQARLHPNRPEAPQAKAERVGEERSLLQRILDVREGLGDVTAKAGRVLGGHPIQSMETDREEALQRCGDSEACVRILSENRNLAHGLDETAKDLGEAGGRPAGEGLFDYTAVKGVATVVGFGATAIAKAAESTAPGEISAARRLQLNNLQGRAGEQEILNRLRRNDGVEVLGVQVQVRTPGEGGRRVVDILIRKKSTQEVIAIEVKTGEATRSGVQLAKDSEMATGQGTVFTGRRAKAAGLERGTPTGQMRTVEAHPTVKKEDVP